jgi:hypothetical protein
MILKKRHPTISYTPVSNCTKTVKINPKQAITCTKITIDNPKYVSSVTKHTSGHFFSADALFYWGDDKKG